MAAESIAIDTDFTHPDYDASTGSYDVAIVKLVSESSKQWLKVNPTSTYPPGTPATQVTIAGFGATSEEGADPDVVMTLDLLYITSNACGALLSYLKPADDFHKQLTSDMMCLSEYRSTGQCTKDEGGPMVYLGDTMDDDLLLGVMAW